MKGNKISTVVFNYGSISAPTATGNVLDLAWIGLGYMYEANLLVGAKVQKFNSTDSLKIVSEGFSTPADGEFGPDGTKWGWLPDSGYSNPNQNEIANNNNPNSWPSQWTSWQGKNGDAIADVETYAVMDDFTKKEFQYYPFPNDTTKRGLGLQVSTRMYQFDTPNLEDMFLITYDIKNVSTKK